MIPAAALRKMLDMGLTLEDAVELAEVWEQGSRPREASANAIRQRKYRERKAAESEAMVEEITEDVTRYVTGDVTSNATDETPKQKVSPTPPSKTQPPKGGLLYTTRERETADFDRFWETFPLKVAKDAARRAYAAAIRRIEGPDPPGQILDGLARARPGWIGVEKKFIPHPATWLNQGRWQDEAPETPQTQAMRPAHERPSSQSAKFDRHQANLERANAGAESAARYRAVKSQSCF